MCNRLFALAVVVAAASAPVQSIAAEPHHLTGGISTHVVVPGDSLQTIASRVGVDPSTIAADNGLVPGAKLRPGQPLRIDNRHLVEVHRDVYGRLAGPARSVTRAAAARAGLDAEIDWSIADAVILARHGVARSVRRR